MVDGKKKIVDGISVGQKEERKRSVLAEEKLNETGPPLKEVKGNLTHEWLHNLACHF
jgi:hypothetical protein